MVEKARKKKNMKIHEIESKIAANEMTAAQVFTQMRQHCAGDERVVVLGGGMYGQNSRVQIGNLSISDNGNGKVWIEEADGIGGEFSKEMFDSHVQAFFDRKF